MAVRPDAPVMGGSFGGAHEHTVEGVRQAIAEFEANGVGEDHPTLIDLREELKELLTA